ncbi:Crp/Fnr family transcriptional regulator [Rhodopseudomonas sp. B29]|uniref:Crp/Fnr family transcriptional regulator n=1 Tax=Rhodopseudomonas sp. B29 TaxID=95607 RepID=UPI000346430B|nr:Crp/Fnr family transcriptional regulator [Rhodopseudomonas sp. B29]
MALTPADQDAFFRAASPPRHAAKGECLIEAGSDFSSLLVIRSGIARKVRTLSDGTEQIVAMFVEGDSLNAGDVVFHQSQNAVYALTAATYVSIPHGKLKDLLDSRPAIARALWQETAAQAAIQQEWMIWLGQCTAQSRLAHFLCELSHRLQIASSEFGGATEFPLTQNDLADLLGMSTVHVNRSLQALRSRGLIELTRSRLLILDKKNLYSIAEFDPQYLIGQRRAG